MQKRLSVGELFALNQQLMQLAARAYSSDISEPLAMAEMHVTQAIRAVAYADACDLFNTAQAMAARGEVDSSGAADGGDRA